MNNQTYEVKHITKIPAIALLLSLPVFAQTPPHFTPGSLVVTVEGNGVPGGSGSFGDNQASPLTLFQFTTSGTYVNSLVLPQTGSAANLPRAGRSSTAPHRSV